MKGLAENWKEMEKVLNGKFVYEAPFIYYDDVDESYQEFKQNTVGQSHF